MPRRRDDSALDEIVSDTWEILLATPWWTCLIIAAFLYAVFAYLIPAILSGSQIMAIFIPTSRHIAAPFVGGGVLVMGVLAQIVKHNRRRLAFRPADRHTLNSLTWRQFEQLVGAVYGQQGYRVVEVGGSGPDGGFDLILHGNSEKVLVQCKQWRSYTVGVRLLREFHGVLTSRNTTAHRGIFVTMGTYTKEASKFADENSIELVDGDRLLKMMRAIQSDQSQLADPRDLAVSPQAHTPPAM